MTAGRNPEAVRQLLAKGIAAIEAQARLAQQFAREGRTDLLAEAYADLAELHLIQSRLEGEIGGAECGPRPAFLLPGPATPEAAARERRNGRERFRHRVMSSAKRLSRAAARAAAQSA